jgi:hypothetical protein
LLKSLAAADFTASSVPHLTIDLPEEIDLPTKRWLESFQWPPARILNPGNVRQLSLRHRIAQHGISEEESSARFLESFWPADPEHSHVIVLSPQTELNPNFFQCELMNCISRQGHELIPQSSGEDLRYTLLEYRYSNAAILHEWDQRLFGISLDLPTTNLDLTTKFTPPPSLDNSRSSVEAANRPTSFLWQAPNSDAMLFLGERWVELHGFVSGHLAAQRRRQLPAFFAKKLVSKKYPAWLELCLRLSQVRGYWTLYPSEQTANVLAAVHNELYTPPEEYEKDLGKTKMEKPEVALGVGSFVDTLPVKGALPPFQGLPLLAWDGKQTDMQTFTTGAAEYAESFRRLVGLCEVEGPEKVLPRPDAKDLFCQDAKRGGKKDV